MAPKGATGDNGDHGDNGGHGDNAGDNRGQFPCTDFGPRRDSGALPTPPGT